MEDIRMVNIHGGESGMSENYGGNGSNEYVLGVMGYSSDIHSTFKIDANVETTIAVSLDSETHTGYLFYKESNNWSFLQWKHIRIQQQPAHILIQLL